VIGVSCERTRDHDVKLGEDHMRKDQEKIKFVDVNKDKVFNGIMVEADANANNYEIIEKRIGLNEG
jgi:hypothetical protein